MLSACVYKWAHLPSPRIQFSICQVVQRHQFSTSVAWPWCLLSLLIARQRIRHLGMCCKKWDNSIKWWELPGFGKRHWEFVFKFLFLLRKRSLFSKGWWCSSFSCHGQSVFMPASLCWVKLKWVNEGENKSPWYSTCRFPLLLQHKITADYLIGIYHAVISLQVTFDASGVECKWNRNIRNGSVFILKT